MSTPLKQTLISVDIKTFSVFVAQAGDEGRAMNHNFVGCISKEKKKKLFRATADLASPRITLRTRASKHAVPRDQRNAQ